NIVRTTPHMHLSTYTMETSDNFDTDDFDQDIYNYIHRIHHCSNQSEAINLRLNALKFIDQWRLQFLEKLEHRVRTAEQLILNAFDEYQSRLC
ncbi:unnamed protein product, partial [Rotaria socialis]